MGREGVFSLLLSGRSGTFNYKQPTRTSLVVIISIQDIPLNVSLFFFFIPLSFLSDFHWLLFQSFSKAGFQSFAWLQPHETQADYRYIAHIQNVLDLHVYMLQSSR